MSWVARLFGNKDAGKTADDQTPLDDPKYQARRKKNAKGARKDVLDNMEAPLSEKIKREKPEPSRAAKIASAPSSKVGQRKRKQRMTLFKKLGVVVAALILSYGIYLLFKPFQGTMKFGICKVFLEQQVQFPQTLRLSVVREFAQSARIWYSHVDAFGAYRLEPMECFYKADERYGAVIDYVTIGRRQLDPDIIERFNASIPVIVQNPPDLTLPTGFPDTLTDLKFEEGMFRKRLF